MSRGASKMAISLPITLTPVWTERHVETSCETHGKMTLPDTASRGAWVLRSLSMKMNRLDISSQVSAVNAPGVLLTLVIFSLNSVPDPDKGVKSFE